MNKKELENLNACVASALTELLNWNEVGRKIALYATSTLPHRIMMQTIEKQLNPVIDGSAAFIMMLKAYEKAFDNFEVYNKNPNQFFVDCGIIEKQMAELPECKQVLDDAVSAQAAFDGSISPDALLQALKWLVLPSARVDSTTQISSNLYLWKDALVKILEDLGWNDSERNPAWVDSAWMQITEKKGVFPYEGIGEISAMIMATMADGGLWRAAMKAICFEVQIGGYIGCDVFRDGKKKAAEHAHALMNGDQTDLHFVNDSIRWPDWVKEQWDATANPASHGDANTQRPNFLPLAQADDFLQRLIYKPVDKKTIEAVKKDALSASSVDDLQWLLGDDGNIWDGDKRIRGFWLELFLATADRCDFLPKDLDGFFDCLKWQKQKDEENKLGRPRPWLLFSSLRNWLDEVIVGGVKSEKDFTLTANQFVTLLNSYMDCQIPSTSITPLVFTPCPLLPNDDQGELRYLCDLAAALRTWLGYGMWKGAIAQVIDSVLPRGERRTLALKILPAEFDKLDTDGAGILQPGQALMLLQKLVHPGLTLPEVTVMLQEDLGLAVPEREVHKYFTTIDINGDGVLQVGEFIAFLRIVMIHFFPRQILEKMNLSTGNIIKLIVVLVLCLIILFIAITLVIMTFQTNPTVRAGIHTVFRGGSAMMVKMQGDASSGAGGVPSEIRARVEETVMTALTAVLGLGPAVIEQLKQLTTQLV
jgi:hypothetical protein